MNVLLLILGAAVLFPLAFRIYSRILARNFGEDPQRTTPAVEINDGRDYCPTRTPVVFAHHFASIAGAGPILGPTFALMYGVVPVWLWVVFGGILIGAVHDYSALFASLREKGKSVAEIARSSLGEGGFALMIAFTIMMILLVTSSFLVASATSLTSLVPLAKMNLPEGQTLLKTVTRDGVVMGRIGGIASTSVIVITLFAPLVGYLNYRRKMAEWVTAPTAILVCLISIVVGLALPISLPMNTWMILLSIYTLFAAGIPVWLLLQPRDYTNVFILYAGIILLAVGGIASGLRGTLTVAPLFNIAQGNSIASLGLIWPFLFITVACGAISGFHSLVAGGTVSKQVKSERAARGIGYGGMLLESLLAVGVIAAVGSGIAFADYRQIVFPVQGRSNPILAFALGMSGMVHRGLGLPMAFGSVFGILMVEGFIATTLDTAVRLNRYLFEELWTLLFKNPPAILRKPWFNAGLCVVLMLFLAFTNAFNALWPIFGASNQLLAALTLITITVWLVQRNKRGVFTFLPAVFMTVTTLAALVFLFQKYLSSHNYILLAADVILFAFAIGLVVIAFRVGFGLRGRSRRPVVAEASAFQ